MAQQDYYAGFDFARIGAMSFTVTNSSGGQSDILGFTSGTYAHVGFTAGSTAYAALATSIQAALTALTALGGGRPTYTFTFSQTTMQYSLDSNTGTLTLTFPASDSGDRAKHILGFSASVGATSSPIVSDRRPYYAIRAACEGPSAYSFYYETGDGIYEEEADDGSTYSITRTTLPKLVEWEQRMEAKAAPATNIVSGAAAGGAGMRIADASTEVPWTWEHFFQHARCVNPFAFHNSTGPTGIVCKFRKDGAAFHPALVVADYSSLWNVPIRARYLGTY